MDIVTILILVFVALNVADVATTNKVLSEGGIELNPIARFFMDKLGILTGLVLLKVAIGICVVLLCEYNVLAWSLVNLLYAVVVYHNLTQMRK